MYRDGKPVGVTPKALATLIALVSRHGAAVSKEELLATVWPDTTVEESNLSQNVYTLRKLLAPDFPDETPIENIPRFGYRFNLEVTEEALETPKTVEAPKASEEAEVLLSPAVVVSAPSDIENGRSRRLAWVVPLALVLGLGASLPLWWAAATSRFSPKVPAYDIKRFTSNSDEDRVTAVGLSPDGKLVAYADADGIVLRGVQDATTHFLPSPHLKVVQGLSWFSDQLHLVLSGEDAVMGEPQVWKISVLGEPPVLLRKDARLGVPSHDGSSVAFTSADGSQVWVMGSSGEGAHAVVQGGLGERFSMVLWTRNDSGLLLERRDFAARAGLKGSIPHMPAPDDRMVYERVDVHSGVPTTVKTDFAMGDACLTSNDSLIYSAVKPEAGEESNTLWKVGMDASSGALDGSPVKLMEVPDHYFHRFSCDTEGKTIAALREQGTANVFIGAMRQGGIGLTDVRLLSQDSEEAYPHGWTSDSRAVLYEAMRNGQWQVYSHALDRHDPQPLTSLDGSESRPVMTADHRWLLFLDRAAAGARRTLYRMPSQGGLPEAVPAQENLEDFRCPLHSGSCIVRTKSANGQGIYSVLDPVSGKEAALFVEPSGWNFGRDWDISPDGSTLAICADTANGLSLHTVSVKTGAVKDIAYRPASRIMGVNWAASGDALLVSGTEPSVTSGSTLFYVQLNGKAVPLRSMSVETWAEPSPDGRWLAFVDRTLDSNVWLLQAK